MDEGLLNDLLECSVCLERLDTSSRVLPCQHTFCLKCLKVIVESHKELRCPECRVLVETKVEELPPNVLLMRILEGMKNSAPRKISGQRVRSGHSQTQTQLQFLRAEGKQPPPHARAMYDYISKELGDLSFKKGETIILQKKLDPFWYHGECSGRSGIFPITYVQVAVPLPVSTALCKALYDFRMSAPDEEGCLAFDKGAIITVHRRVDENWAEGRLDQRVGIFPIAFVELNQAARQLMNTAPLNRPVPPIPDHTRPSHSEHRHHAQHPHRYQPMSISTPTSGQSQGNYQNIPTMSQSHPNQNYHSTQTPISTPTPILIPQPVNHISSITHGSLLTTTAVPRNIMEPTQNKHSLDLIHFSNMHNKTHQLSTIQSVSRIGESYDRLRAGKFDNYNSTPVHKLETTYQNVRTHEHFPVTSVNFTNNSSDSSSSVNTPSAGVVSSTTTPNTSSDTSTCESAEPSLPSSPDNAERSVLPPTNSTQNNHNTQNSMEIDNQEAQETSLNASLGVLNLNESSTATNTSLNVSLPPSESPKLNASGGSNSLQNQVESQETSSNNEPSRLEVPTSSKNALRSSGPDSILTFGLGLQAALSPSHSKEGNYMVRGHRDHNHRDREKRHSLTPSTHLQGNHAQNRHSAEILATSLLDHATERERDRPERERERRRRRSRSNERPLPSAYIALYPYKPQKPDELELKKGGIYTVTERCRDGWYKGCCERVQRCGVFPGNYVAPLTPLAPLQPRIKHDKSVSSAAAATAKPTVAVSSSGSSAANATLAPPDAPPRATSPLVTAAQPLTYPWHYPVQPQQGTPRSEKSKDKSKAEKSSISTGVSLMKRLAAMKKCKSPPPAGYSMDNPVFDDGPSTSLVLPNHPHHVRSGSCPSQLLRALPAPLAAPPGHPAHAAHAARGTRHHDHRSHRGSGESGEWAGHRKSASLDVTARRERHHSQPIKEKFRCIVPYPPNSEYELELKVDDIVIVCKKRGDGWYKGTLQRTGRTGLFPASFVQSVPPD
ncbi:E3 ubiquitin-protein ligase SH3RF3 isoform X2 [Pararge aegeria]|uniref:E3 ubiquitin-protein ligase SH3RF3 isoform X2 n=1 Tax=Pararge aegeria TaxID=116150 RepID=UPI0019D30BE8|nr:E3 ubiquitin-protein ligase SH3RF3 isoform X2 [Pararge aegeria]